METDGFDLCDLVDTPPSADVPTTTDELVAWTNQVIEKATARERAAGAVIWDIETGPQREDELAAKYREKTLEEFADSCDKRWKPDTVTAKYDEYKVKAWGEFVAKAALSPMTGRVLLIGTLVGDELTYLDFPDEKELLETFWAATSCTLAAKTPLIGHNSNSFDLPFVRRRSWALGVHVPRDVWQGRWCNPLFRDTLEQWACGSRDYVRLNTLAEFFGVGQKTEGVSGGDFSKLWFGQMEGMGTPEEQRAKALEYNGQDLRLTQAIAVKMGMI